MNCVSHQEGAVTKGMVETVTLLLGGKGTYMMNLKDKRVTLDD